MLDPRPNPSTHGDKTMTTEQIERSVEIKSDAADRALMNGHMTQAEYDTHMKELNRWADRQYGWRTQTRAL